MPTDRTDDERPPGGGTWADPDDDVPAYLTDNPTPSWASTPEQPTVRYPAPGGRDPDDHTPADARSGTQAEAPAWSTASADVPAEHALPYAYPLPGGAAPPAGAPGPPSGPAPGSAPSGPASGSALSGITAAGLAAVSTLRRHRRQTITFTAILALVLVLGAGAFAVFKGTIGWPFGGGSPAPTASACPTPSPRAQAAALTKVRVYNATSKRGFALSVSRDLQKRGFKVSTVGNDPLGSKPTTPAVIRYGPAGLLAAHTVGTQVVGAVVYQQDERTGDLVDLVLGPNFALLDAVKGAAAIKATPTATPVPGCTPTS